MKQRFEKIMKRLGWMRIPPTPPALPQLTEAQFLAAFAEHSALWPAVLIVLQESIDGTNVVGQTPMVAVDHGKLAYYAGVAAGLEQFRDALYARRRIAIQASQA